MQHNNSEKDGIKNYHHLFGWSTVVLTGVFFALLLFWLPQYQEPITKFTIEHPLLAPLILIAWRFIGVVIPPIPAGILSYTLIPVLGWFWVYLYSTIGLLLGACVAFLLARWFREPLVKRFVPLKELNRWEGKVSKSTEFWGFLLIRFTTEPVMDFISYLAGLTKISFGKFFFATLLSLLPTALGYYLGEQAYIRFIRENSAMTIGFVLFLGIVALVFKDKIKYLKEKK